MRQWWAPWWCGVLSVINVILIGWLFKAIWNHDQGSIPGISILIVICGFFWLATLFEPWEKS